MHRSFLAICVGVLVPSSVLAQPRSQKWGELFASVFSGRVPTTDPRFDHKCSGVTSRLPTDSIALIGGRQLNRFYLWAIPRGTVVAEWVPVTLPTGADTLVGRIVGVVCGSPASVI